MSERTFHPHTKRRELLDVETGKSGREEDEEKVVDCLQEFSCCPACDQECDALLILPCSHTMCVCCVAAGEGKRSSEPHRRGVGPPICSVLCPICQHPVELPCWNWSSATSCLPKHPTLRPVGVSRETVSGGHLQRGNLNCWDAAAFGAHSCLHGSSGTISSESPVDGAVDLREEEMEQSVFGLCFALDPSTAPPSLHLSTSSLTITYLGEGPTGPAPDSKVKRSVTRDPGLATALLEVCADVTLARGQYYWEVDVCNSSVYRIGVKSRGGSVGCWLERRGMSFGAVHDGSWEPLCTVPPQIKSVGVFLNIGGGALSFHNSLAQEHLATLPTRFDPAGVIPALSLGQGRLRLRCGLPPPPHVFLSKDSTYRALRGAAAGRWRREIPFQSVRRAIQKFEELAASDSDSGFLSSFGSSSSTLASLSDLGIHGMAPSGQETGAE